MDLRQNSKAKFGAAEIVALWSWISQSQRAGSAKKERGDMINAGAP